MRGAQFEMACAERAEFAEFLATLTPQQWQACTLCSEWNV
ncbi:DinB family protein, partial [Mycobacterium sp. ITM-2017-0098]